MRARLLVACAALAVLVAGSGSVGTAAAQQAPAYGVIASMNGAGQTLVQVDPSTLKRLPGGLSLPEGLAFGARSPDGRSAIFFDFRRPSVRVVDLEGLATRAQIVLAPGKGWRARAAAWLTADRVAVVLQKMRGSYGQIVDRRQVVIVDPLAGRAVARREVPGAMALTASASGGDKLVLLLGRGDARVRAIRIVVVDPTGRVRTVDADLGAVTGLRLPALAVEPSGRRAFVVAAGSPVLEIDLETMKATPHALEGGGAVFARAPLAARQAVVLDGGTLAVTGHNTHREKGLEVSRPVGLALVDTATWRLRLVDREVSGVSVSAKTLLGYSFRIDRVLHRGRPIQKVTGIGLRAYSPDGTRLWHQFDRQPLTASAFRDVALVYRHASPPVGWGGSFVIDLSHGRQIRSNTGAQQNFWLLPDVQGARAVRAPAAAWETEAVQLEGGSDSFEASVRDDVTRVVATLVDGSERELAIEGGRVEYEAATPDESAHAVQAFAGDRLLASISIPVACGGSAGPCASAEPVRGGTFAILRSRAGTSLAEVDPKTLEPLPGRSVAIDNSTSASGLSADGGRAAVGSYENATVRVFDTARLRRADLVVPLAPGNAGVVALAWLAPDRLVAIVQKYKRRDRRAVSARELVVLEPEARRVVQRTELPIGRAIVDVQASGGKLVAVLRSSNHRGTGITVVVADADGRVRMREIRLRQNDGVLPETRLTLERGGRRAFLFAWPQPLREIDLARLTVTRREVTIAEGRFYRPSGFMARAESFGENGVLISGAFVPLFQDGKHVPAAGTFLLDTRTFLIRQLDSRAGAFVVAGDRAYTFGSTARALSAPPHGIGVAAYDTTGKQLYHAFGTRTFSRLVVAGAYGHLLRGDQTDGLAFELESGRSLGPRPAPGREIEVLAPAEAARLASAPPRRTPAATTAAATASPAVTDDSFARVSNRGTRVEATTEKRGEREMTPRDLFLLRRGEGRAVYRIGGLRAGYDTCYASGPADDLGRLGQVGCGKSGFPSRQLPVYDMSSLQMKRGEKTPHLLHLAGVAADGVAAVGLLDAEGRVVERVPVERNVYLLASTPAAATGALAALDGQGKIVYRNDRPARATPPAPKPGRLAGFRLKLTLPDGWRGEIRRSSAGPGRALLFAGNRLPAKDPRVLSLVIDERDPRARPAFARVSAPPRLSRREVRTTGNGIGRIVRRFTLEGRQFTLEVGFGSTRPSAVTLAEVNRILATLEVGALAVPPSPASAGQPLQHGSADGVSVDVFRAGLVVFRFDPTGKAYRLLGRRQVSVACLTFDSVHPWEPNEWWSSKPAAPTIQFVVSEATRPRPPFATVDEATEAKPPFDGCLASGSYGRRWNDPRGQHSPAEIAFTAQGRRFFDERAVARDLALFVRSPKLAAARRSLKQGANAPVAAALTLGLPSRVIALSDRGRLPALGEIGVWSDGRETLALSARSATGKRLFVEIRGGRIGRHNLEGLAFVF